MFDRFNRAPARTLPDVGEFMGEGEGMAWGSVLAALAAHPAGASGRKREVEDAIRMHWAALQSLVREHAELTRAALDVAPEPADRSAPQLGQPRMLGLGRAALVRPPRAIPAAE